MNSKYNLTIGYNCQSCGNIYALVLERSMCIIKKLGFQGFIVPVSSVSTDRYEALQKRLTNYSLWYSSFDDRPSRLFDGLEHIRLTIHIIGPKQNNSRIYSSRYNKWNENERSSLFEKLQIIDTKPTIVPRALPKLNSSIENIILSKISDQSHRLSDYFEKSSQNIVFYSRKVGYFLQVINFIPEVIDRCGNLRHPSEFKTLCFANEVQSWSALCCLNSNLFYWFVTVFSDCRHLNKREIDSFPLDLENLSTGISGERLKNLGIMLMSDLRSNSEIRQMRYKHDELSVQCILPKSSKPIIDKIDLVLAQHYGIIESEYDFLINYDIKYRMRQKD